MHGGGPPAKQEGSHAHSARGFYQLNAAAALQNHLVLRHLAVVAVYSFALYWSCISGGIAPAEGEYCHRRCTRTPHGRLMLDG